MARKKRVVKKSGVKSVAKKSASVSSRIGIAWRNLLLFLVLFIASYLLYSFSETNLFLTFFGLLSVIFGFVTFAFLIALVVLVLSRRGKN
ncbi:MAG: hypothetical protein Q8P81_03095 [Nanoarchaeota archaeon]|nr:hypothetical protein [Nanoarchaeota archaeon]